MGRGVAACKNQNNGFGPPFAIFLTLTTQIRRDVSRTPRHVRGFARASPHRTSILTSFNDFGLAEPITRSLAEEQYSTPTPIQCDAIPIVLAGRDIVGIAQTGTGKTAAFALPILNRLAANPRRADKKCCRVLVLSPTRELSGQILDSFPP